MPEDTLSALAEKKARLEIERLKLEIATASKPWWKGPALLSVVTPVTTAIIALVSAGFVAWWTGYFSEERIRLANEQKRLEASVAELTKQQTNLFDQLVTAKDEYRGRIFERVANEMKNDTYPLYGNRKKRTDLELFCYNRENVVIDPTDPAYQFFDYFHNLKEAAVSDLLRGRGMAENIRIELSIAEKYKRPLSDDLDKLIGFFDRSVKSVREGHSIELVSSIPKLKPDTYELIQHFDKIASYPMYALSEELQAICVEHGEFDPPSEFGRLKILANEVVDARRTFSALKDAFQSAIRGTLFAID